MAGTMRIQVGAMKKEKTAVFERTDMMALTFKTEKMTYVRTVTMLFYYFLFLF